MSAASYISFLGYCSGLGGPNPASCMGPLALQAYFVDHKFDFPTEWIEMIYPRTNQTGLEALPEILEINRRLAQYTQELAVLKKDFIVFGGDHSSAIGTWSGVAKAYHSQGEIGLIWIDAHMDSHTIESTPSQNIHGMPLAVLLGYGDSQLTNLLEIKPKVLPKNLCIIGARSFEPQEAEFLQRLGVRIYYMEAIKQKGMQEILKEAIQQVNQNSIAFGVSLDLDAIDPVDAPGTGSIAADGIAAEELCASFQFLRNEPRLCGFEISEYDPSLDINNRTAHWVYKIIQTIYR